jgi:hypothetical protein
LQSCGDDNEDEPTVNDIQGTWLLTHYSYKYHYLHNDTWWDDTKDEDVTSSYLWDDPMGSEPTKYMEHLTFDKNNVSVWLAKFPLPTMPRASQYDNSTPEGQLEYFQDFENWVIAIDCQIEGFPWECPYSLKGSKLYIGTLCNGDIEFNGSDSFSLTYKDTAFDKQGEYKLYVYTFKRSC